MRRLAALVFATAVAMAMSAVRAVADDVVVLAGTIRDGGEPVSTRVRVYRLQTALEALWTTGPSSANPTEFPDLWFSGVFELFHPADRTRYEVAVAESDASGTFKVQGLAPGNYECEVQTQDGGVAISGAVQRHAGVHEVVLDLAKDTWPIVRGRLLEHDGRPFRGLVHAWHSGMVPGALGVSVPTDAEGNFAIRVPTHHSNGDVGLAAIEPGRRVIRWKVTPDRAGGVIYVGGGHGRLPVVVRAGGTGAPVPGARVLRATRLSLPGGHERQVFELAVTDATGHARIGRPPPCGTTGYVVIHAPGFQRTVDPVEATDDRLEFTLASSVRVTGRLEGHVPADASAWIVTLWFWPSTWFMPIWRTAPLRQDGTFDVGDLPGAPNHAIVGVRGPGFVGVRCLDSRLDALVRLPAWMVPPIWQAPLEASEWPRCPEEEREPHRELVVPIEATTRLSVAVRDAAGERLAGARVSLGGAGDGYERPLGNLARRFARRGLADERGFAGRLGTTNGEGIVEFDELVVGVGVALWGGRGPGPLDWLGEVRVQSSGIQTAEFTLPDAKD